MIKLLLNKALCVPCLGLGLAMFICLTANATSFAASQESETSFAGLQAQWQQLDAKLAVKKAEITAEVGDAAAKREEFKLLATEADALVEKLRTAGVKELNSDPKNKEAIRLLLGIMINDAHHGRDDEVMALGDIMIAQGINEKYFIIASRADRLTIAGREMFDELLIRQAETTANDLPRVKFTTTQGDIVIELFENEAPGTVGNFISLVEKNTYSDVLFHRVMEGFMAQTGGYKLEGVKEVGGQGPGYNIKCESDSPERRLHFTGSVSMAHLGLKDTGGSQFFLSFKRTNLLDGLHTCFGRIIEGADVLDKIARTHTTNPQTGKDVAIPDVTKDKLLSAEVLRKRDHEYVPDKVAVVESTEPQEQAEPAKEDTDSGSETNEKSSTDKN
ncbi:MAG: cyclophilin family peptidyl-prolyl cis-trans isomerase [Mariniblastus sp.]|jgi:cyclophilin family peptidyl-prolyl cis-trans isomerase